MANKIQCILGLEAVRRALTPTTAVQRKAQEKAVQRILADVSKQETLTAEEVFLTKKKPNQKEVVTDSNQITYKDHRTAKQSTSTSTIRGTSKPEAQGILGLGAVRRALTPTTAVQGQAQAKTNDVNKSLKSCEQTTQFSKEWRAKSQGLYFKDKY